MIRFIHIETKKGWPDLLSIIETEDFKKLVCDDNQAATLVQHESMGYP